MYQKSCIFNKFDILLQNDVEIGIFFYFDEENSLLFYNLLNENDFEIPTTNSFEDLYYDNKWITNKSNDDFMTIQEQSVDIDHETNYFDIIYMDVDLLYKSIFVTPQENELIKNSHQAYLIPFNYVFIFNEFSLFKSIFKLNVREPIIDLIWGFYDNKFIDCIEFTTIDINQNVTIFEEHPKILQKI